MAMELFKLKTNILSRNGCGWTLSAVRRSSIRHITTSSSVNSNEKYLQESKIPTMHFQPSLPRLPIPKLPDSCQRYLAALRPILSDEEYMATEKIVNDFAKEGSDGWELNQRLITRDQNNKDTSFIADYWYEMYLRDRRSIVLNQNPCMIFQHDPRNPSQLDRASNFIRTIVRFRNSLMDNKLFPEVYHLDPAKSDNERFNLLRFIPSTFAWYGAYMINAFPLDMVQYKKLFNSTRIPRPERDELVSYHGNHIVVIHNGHYYTLDVIQPNGDPVDINRIHASLEAIVNDSTTPSSHSIGYLATTDRDTWTDTRARLLNIDPNNERLLDIIDSALVVLSLDDTELPEDDPKLATELFLHNKGFNRWVDKSIQFIVTRNGVAGVTFEHSWGDGVAVLRLFNEIYKETTTTPLPITDPSCNPIPPQRLEFNLDGDIKKAIELAKLDVESRCSELSIDTLQYHGMGKDLLKKAGLSPDAVLQLALQMAYYREYKHADSTYESCSTAGFKHGRTETIRPATMATLNCSKAFEPNSGASNEEKVKLIKESVAKHSKLVREAATGNGFDRHLFALKCLAESEFLTMPIFQDPSYSRLNTIVLSTSTLAADSLLLGGFAPVNPDSYGMGYSVKDDMIGTNISTYPTRDGVEFNKNMSTILDELKKVINSIQPPASER